MSRLSLESWDETNFSSRSIGKCSFLAWNKVVSSLLLLHTLVNLVEIFYNSTLKKLASIFSHTHIRI